MNTADILLDLYDRTGDVDPAALVDEAADTSHPLHDQFEWDDEIAGREYRLIQASRIIRACTVVVPAGPEAEPIRVRAVQSVTGQAGGRGPVLRRTVPTVVVLADRDLMANVAQQIQDDIDAMRRKWSAHRTLFNSVLHRITEDAA